LGFRVNIYKVYTQLSLVGQGRERAVSKAVPFLWPSNKRVLSRGEQAGDVALPWQATGRKEEVVSLAAP
jgi:hypothetical protein